LDWYILPVPKAIGGSVMVAYQVAGLECPKLSEVFCCSLVLWLSGSTACVISKVAVFGFGDSWDLLHIIARVFIVWR
jgi:hypothetical protein